MDEQRLGILSDVRSLLQPLKDDLTYLKQEIKEVKKMMLMMLMMLNRRLEKLID